MQIAVITLFPAMLQAIKCGVTGRAIADGLLELATFNPRDHATDRHRSVDERPYGGGPGMVMRCEPLAGAVQAARRWLRGTATLIYLSPQGRRFDQAQAQQTVQTDQNLILLAGRYEGIDERFIELEVDAEWSIGDYVLSGGELPAMVVIDALTRQLPGALGHQDSAAQDSFTTGLLDCPHYTRPPLYRGLQVPPVLLGGDHRKIAAWRARQALERTRTRCPDLLAATNPADPIDHAAQPNEPPLAPPPAPPNAGHNADRRLP
ncbi:MAG: tRNA (guanosine(37)-N1)-methyltransferase TrmD [Cellvibrionales bacterium]|nr:tRNA (guanosine(37)-N1)-methyltransferase TrmD [Cellvibrionales bacterium]